MNDITLPKPRLVLGIIILSILVVSCNSKTLFYSKTNQNTVHTANPTIVYENSQDTLQIDSGKEMMFTLDDSYSVFYPTMSPDENWIAVPVYDNASTNLPHVYNILVLNLKNPGSGWIPLFSKNSELEVLPKLYFSPNGEYLASVASHNIWFFQVHEWDQQVKYDFEVFSGVASWSPDSSGIAVQIDDNNHVLYILHIDGSKIPLLKKQAVFPDGFPGNELSSVYNWGPSWSPNGRQIAYLKTVQEKSGNKNSMPSQELWILDVSSGKQSRLCAGEFGDPIWSPDGKKIALQGEGIEVYSFDSQSLSKILPSLNSEILASIGPDYSWSPNSDAIVFYMNLGGKQSDGIFIVDIVSGQYEKIFSGFASPYTWSKNNNLLIVDKNSDNILLKNVANIRDQ